MYFLKLSVITHVFQFASADPGMLLTGDLIESLSQTDRLDTISSDSHNFGTILLFGLQDACISIVTYFWLGVKKIVQ